MDNPNMMIRALTFVVIILCFAAVSSAQNPMMTAPQAYKLQFENDWVQVTRVHYAPHEKIAAHDHSRWPAAYVYLNDGGPVIFRHVGWHDHPDLTRPATKAGSFRLSPTLAVKETHEVINPTGLASDFLRVEFKTRPDTKKPLRGRFHRENYPAGENFSKVQFENEQIRVTRSTCRPRQNTDFITISNEPALIVFLSAARLQLTGPKGKAKEMNLEQGQTVWLGGSQQKNFENIGGESIEFLRFDLMTVPVKAEGELKRNQ